MGISSEDRCKTLLHLFCTYTFIPGSSVAESIFTIEVSYDSTIGIGSKGLVTNYGEGGGLQNGRGDT